MAKQILNAVPELLYETTIPVRTYRFVAVVPRASDEPPRPEPSSETACVRCGKDPAEGWAIIAGRRYCHGEHNPSCYMLASWGP